MLPTASTSGTNNSSRRGSAALITEPPHKQKLLNCMKKKVGKSLIRTKESPCYTEKEENKNAIFRFE
jgi:hypothetical protein